MQPEKSGLAEGDMPPNGGDSPRLAKIEENETLKVSSVAEEGLSGPSSPQSGRSHQEQNTPSGSDFEVGTSRSADSVSGGSTSTELRTTAMKHLSNVGHLGKSTDRYTFFANSNVNDHPKESMVALYSPYPSIRQILEQQATSNNRAESPSKLVGMYSGNLKCFASGEEVVEHKHLPPHLHGAPTTERTVNALKKFQNMRNYDSQDCEPQDSALKREASLLLPRRHFMLSSMYQWLLTFAIGITMGAVTFCMSYVIQNLIKARLNTTEELILSGQTAGAIAFYVGLAVGLVVMAALPVALWEPLAAGSGMAEIKVYLNGIHIPGLLRLTTFAVKVFGLCLAVPAGLVVGTTGPFVHLGGLVGGGVGSLGSNLFNFKFNKRYLDFQTKNSHRDFVTVGIAAGIAAVFTAPIGGVLIAFEDCGSISFGSIKMFWQCFLATCTAVYFSYILQLLLRDPANFMTDTLGIPRAFALYSDSIADYTEVYRFCWWEVFLFALMGAIAGLFGTAFVFLHMKVTKFRSIFIPVTSPTRRVLEVIWIILVTAAISVLACYFSSCRAYPDQIEDYPLTITSNTTSGSVIRNPNFPQLWCPDGTYSTFGILFFNPVGMSTKKIIHLGETVSDQDEYSVTVLAVYLVTMYCLLILTYGSSVPGGTWVPLMAIGATYGRLFAHLVHWATWDSTLNLEGRWESYSTYAVVGSACMLSGVTRMTLSITVVVLETTGSLQLTIPLMASVFFAKMIGDLTGIGLYDAYIQLKGVPYLPEDTMSYEHRMVVDKLDVREIMTSDLDCLSAVPTVEEIVGVLRNSGHSAFPVVQTHRDDDHDDESLESGGSELSATNHSDEETPLGHDNDEYEISLQKPQLQGMIGSISRSTLISMLSKRIGFLKEGEEEYHLNSDNQSDVVKLLGELNVLPLKKNMKHFHEIVEKMTDKDMLTHVDLRPFIQLDPYVISADASVAKAYRLFQKMGLNHLYVSPAGSQPITGVITRKDLTNENCLLLFGERATCEVKLRNSSSYSSQG